MVSHCSIKDHKETERGKIITRRKYLAPLEKPYGGFKAECRQRELQNLEQMPWLGSVGGVLWGFQAKAGLVNLNQKDCGLGKLCVGCRGWGTGAVLLSKECTRWRPWEVGKQFITRKVISKTDIYLCLCYLGLLSWACACVRHFSQLLAPAGHLTKQNPRPQHHGVAWLNELLTQRDKKLYMCRAPQRSPVF